MPPVRLDAHGRIDVDVACAQCNYNLRMRRPGEACPECGRAIDAAVNSVPLAASDAHWLARIRSSAKLLWISVALAFPFIYPGLIVSAIAVWRLTTKEPGRAERRSEWAQRILARGLTTLGVAASVLTAIWGASRLWQHGVGGGQWRLFDTLFSGSHAMAIIGLMWSWRSLYNLAARADAPQAAQAIKQLWRRYFLGLIALGLIAMLVNAYEYLDIDPFLSPFLRHRKIIPTFLLLALAALLCWEWWSTLKTTRQLAKAM